MQHLQTCLLIAEVDRVLCHLVMFSMVFFHWMCKMKYSCFQDSSVIPGWLVFGVLVEKCHRKSDFGWHRFHFEPCLMRNRV